MKFDLPLVAEYRASGETMSFVYVLSESTTVQARRVANNDAVTVTGALANKRATLDALQRFNKRYAKEHLIPLVQELASRCALPVPQNIRIKLMRTRWGSYSSLDNLNLSQNLIFLPTELAAHVILHELAHSVHMNHGPKFHALLAQLDPNKDSATQQLRTAQTYIPLWACAPARLLGDL